MKRHTLTIAVLVLPLLLCRGGFTQTTPPNTPAQVSTIDIGSLDLSVPESPAFVVLGVTPQTITRPTSPRSLATSLLNGVDQNGNFQTGFALDTSPYMLYWGNKLTIQEYQDSRWKQFLARTTLSVGTTKGTTSSDSATRLAVGIRFTIFDKGDPRLDEQYLEDLDKAVQAVLDATTPVPPGSSTEDVDKHEKALTELIKNKTGPIDTARENARKANWNKSSMVVAFAPSWISKSGGSSDLSYNGGAAWASLALQVRTFGQAVFYGQYQNKQSIPDPLNKGQYFLQESTFAGGQMRLGNANTQGILEAVYLHNTPQGKSSQNSGRFSVGAERRLADNLWLHVGVGGQTGAANPNNKMFVLSTLKWGFGGK